MDPTLRRRVTELATRLTGAVPDAVALEGSGWDHHAWRVEFGDRVLIVRLPRDADDLDVAGPCEREAAVMTAARAALGPLVADGRVVDASLGCLAYERLAGEPLAELLPRLDPATVVALAARAGDVIARVARIDPASLAEAPIVDAHPFATWRESSAALVGQLDPQLGAARTRRAQQWLAGPPPPDLARDRLVLAHNDLGAEHLLVERERGALCGVIDWSDAAVTDPAGDLGRLWRDLGEPACGAALGVVTGLGLDAAGLRARALEYARALVLEDLEYAVEHRPELVARELVAFDRLFGA